MEWMPRLQGRKIHILAPGKTFNPVPMIAPELFTISTPAQLAEAERIDALYLAYQFEAFDMSIEHLFSDLWEKMPLDGVLAFMHHITPGVDVHAEGETIDADGKRTTEHLFGPNGIEWFRKLPGWNMDFWDPEVSFGPDANESMVLRYAPQLASQNRLIVALPND